MKRGGAKMIELTELECCVLIDAINIHLNNKKVEEDVYDSIINKLQGQLEHIDLMQEDQEWKNTEWTMWKTEWYKGINWWIPERMGNC